MIHLTDALEFLKTKPQYDYVLLSPSDFGQLIYNGQLVDTSQEGIIAYKHFLAELIPLLNPANGFVSCVVTDRKYKGKLLSRSNMMINEFCSNGWDIHTYKIWAHTLKTNLYRTTFSHIITFCKGKYSANLISEFRPDTWLIEEPKEFADATEDHHGVIANDVLIRLIASYTSEGDIVLDPFAGTASTGEVAIKLNRKFIGCEIDKTMYDKAQKRLNPLWI